MRIPLDVLYETLTHAAKKNPDGLVSTTLLGSVGYTEEQGKLVPVIPVHISLQAEKYGFTVIATRPPQRLLHSTTIERSPPCLKHHKQ